MSSKTFDVIKSKQFAVFLDVTCYILGKFRKQSSQQRSSLLEAIMISVDNLDENLKKRYKQLAVFLDDSSVPKKVNVCKII